MRRLGDGFAFAGFVVVLTTAASTSASLQAPGTQEQPSASTSAVLINDAQANPGYTMVAPFLSTREDLVDLQGRIVHSWQSAYQAGLTAYLLENGHLLRAGRLMAGEQFFNGAGFGGRIQEFTWDGDLVWDFKYHNEKQLPHHDICRLPNGNVLMLVWNRKSASECIQAGRKPLGVRGDWLYDSIIEIKPTGKTSGEVVWEWHIWDHLIQDHDRSKANYGDVAAHPELIDINFGVDQAFGGLVGLFRGTDKDKPDDDESKKAEIDRLRGIGYVAGPRELPIIPDWPHLNAIAYNAEFDQIMVSSRLMSEIWIIDHSTTTAEAAGHTGGRSGKGGDLLYRWGNPRAYRAGTVKDQTLFGQHNAHWIPKGLPGEGHVLVFNNGEKRPGGNFSSVDELVLPVDQEGRYALTPGAAYGPDQPVWSYRAPKRGEFYSSIISGAHRLPNGNTLICEGMKATIFEVTPDGKVVWKYKDTPRTGAGIGSFVGPAKPGVVLSPSLQDTLDLTPTQEQSLAELQASVDQRLDAIMSDEQRTRFAELRDGKQVVGGFPPHGQLFTAFLLSRLKMTAEQKAQVGQLQQEINGRLDSLLNDDQKTRLRAARSGRPTGLDRVFTRAIFRSHRYAPDHPGLAGRDLIPAPPAGRTSSAD